MRSRRTVALPLVLDDRVLGVLAFSAGRPRRFPPEERAFISSVVAHCADAFARARLYDDARNMERRFQSVLERMPIGVFVTRPPDSTLVFSNDAVARIWRTDTFPVLEGRALPDAEGDASRRQSRC